MDHGPLKVLFVQAAHTATDDRVAYHQRVSLEQAGYWCDYVFVSDTIKTDPDIIICDNPVAIRYARQRFGRHIPLIYDVTEWYPSKKNLHNVSWLLRPLKWCVLLLASLWAGCTADAFIFGEYHKARPFRFFFPRKKHLLLPYYPSLRYVNPLPPRRIDDELRLFYAGPQTEEKGFLRAQELARICEQRLPDKKVIFTAVEGLPFEEFCQQIARQDIFLDLRDNDAENTRCLPIKLFYYLAAGRPVIYSDLKAIRHGVPEIVSDSLVVPNDLQRAADIICAYAASPERYQAVCKRNRQLAEDHYNWDAQSGRFVQFVEQLA